jgi:hypothetical protein
MGEGGEKKETGERKRKRKRKTVAIGKEKRNEKIR